MLFSPFYIRSVDCVENLLKRQDSSYQRLVYSIFYRFHSQQSKVDGVETRVVKQEKNDPQVSLRSELENKADKDSSIRKYVSDDEYLSDSKWKLELDWLTKALESALQLCRWALPTGLFMASYDFSNDISLHKMVICGLKFVVVVY